MSFTDILEPYRVAVDPHSQRFYRLHRNAGIGRYHALNPKFRSKYWKFAILTKITEYYTAFKKKPPGKSPQRPRGDLSLLQNVFKWPQTTYIDHRGTSSVLATGGKYYQDTLKNLQIQAVLGGQTRGVFSLFGTLPIKK